LKTITRSQLEDRKSKGAEIKPLTKKPEIVKDNSTPVADTKDLDRIVEATNNVSDSVAKVADTLSTPNDGMDKLIEALKVGLNKEPVKTTPVAYDLIIKRGRDGLMESIRLTPVTTNRGTN